MYPLLKFDEVHTAIANFSVSVQDPKAAILPSYMNIAGDPVINLLVFYDSPTPPPDIFHTFTNISPISRDVETRAYPDIILSAGSNFTGGLR